MCRTLTFVLTTNHCSNYDDEGLGRIVSETERERVREKERERERERES